MAIRTIFPLVFLALFSPVVHGTDFESAVVLKAQDLLPAEVFESTIYTVHPEVRSDGFLNRYTVTSR